MDGSPTKTNGLVGLFVFLEFRCKSLLVVGPWHPGIDKIQPFELYKRKDPISYYHIQSEEENEDDEEEETFELYKRKDPISYYHIRSEEEDEDDEEEEKVWGSKVSVSRVESLETHYLSYL
jgi:hypothetical protein